MVSFFVEIIYLKLLFKCLSRVFIDGFTFLVAFKDSKRRMDLPSKDLAKANTGPWLKHLITPKTKGPTKLASYFFPPPQGDSKHFLTFEVAPGDNIMHLKRS